MMQIDVGDAAVAAYLLKNGSDYFNNQELERV